MENYRIEQNDAFQNCEDYRLIRDVSNVHKHVRPYQQRSKLPTLIESIEDLYETIINIRFDDEDGSYAHCELVVEAKCTDGVTRSVNSALINVANHWGNRLHELGLRNHVPLLVPNNIGSRFVTREDAKSANLEAYKAFGLRFHMQLLEYDYDLGYAVPIKNPRSIVMKIYKEEKVSFDFTFEVKDLDKKLEKKIVCTDEESSQYRMFETDQEREKFKKDIIISRSKEIEAECNKFLKDLGREVVVSIVDPRKDSDL